LARSSRSLAPLAIGGRLVIPAGDTERHQRSLKVIRLSHGEFREEHLADVTFLLLIGARLAGRGGVAG
jgi:protein-L-isoaspartate O-methyltransferase